LKSSRFIRVIVLFLFFVSGAAGLLYQVSWARQLGGLLGYTVYTSAYTLFSFMVGMALGYWSAGRRFTPRPLFWYGVLEIVVAMWSCVVPALLHAAAPTFIGSTDSGPLNVYAISQILFCLLLLLPATVCLGATWPMIVRFFSIDIRGASKETTTRTPSLSWGYAVNTAGAIFGSVFGATVLLVKAGVISTSYIGAALSTFCGLSAILLSRKFENEPSTSRRSVQTEIETTARIPMHWWSLVCLSGCGILALEVLYFRLFSLVFHNSAYSFGLVIAIFLFALAVGAAASGHLVLRMSATTMAASACAYGGLCIGLSLIIFVRATNFSYFLTDSFQTYLIKGAGLVGIVVLVPIVFLGMILPASWQALKEAALSPKQVSQLTALSTVSGAVGSLSASFILPRLGLWMSFALVASVFLAAGIVLFLRIGPRIHLLLIFASLLVIGLAGWDTSRNASTLSPGSTLIRRWETAYGWIDLISTTESSFEIHQNLHYGFGSTTRSVRRDYRQGHLPLLLHRDAQSVLFLGMGTGQTASASLQHVKLKSITVCELIPEAVEAARNLETNRGLLSDPKVRIHIGDARKFLRDSGNRYDVIVSDLFVPWESHTGYLYTVEQYRAGLRALNEGGLFCQWLPVYQMGSDDFEMIANSFATVFPFTTLWWAELDSDRAVIGLIGSREPLDFLASPASKGKSEFNPFTKKQDLELATGNGILSLYLGDWHSNSSATLNTEEHPRIEFSAPIHHVNKSKLRGRRLENYFDDTLSELPFNNLLLLSEIGPMAEKKARVIFQRVEMMK